MPRPPILIVGGPDVAGRIELMQSLAGEFEPHATGSSEQGREAFERAGFAYHPYRLSGAANPLADLRAVCELHALISRINPAIVHAFDTKPAVLARLAARLAGVRVVIGTITGLGSLYTDRRSRARLLRHLYEPLQRLACHVSDLTIFYNAADRDLFLRRGLAPPGRTRVLPGSGVRTDRFDPAAVPESARLRVRKELGIPPDSIVVTMAARLIHSKGVREFTEAARLLSFGGPTVRFVLAGAWDRHAVDALEENEVAQILRAVLWAGERTDMPAVWAASDLAVLPSHGEGLPRALIEAAAMGLPLVASDIPGCRTVVEPGVNGELVPVGDAAALAQAILRLARDPALRRRWGKASREMAVTRLDLRLVAKALARTYRGLLGPQRRDRDPSSIHVDSPRVRGVRGPARAT